jgi:hypothetical protein
LYFLELWAKWLAGGGSLVRLAGGGSLVRLVGVPFLAAWFGLMFLTVAVSSLAVELGIWRLYIVVCVVVGQGNWKLGAHLEEMPKHLKLPLTMRELAWWIVPLLLV